MLTAEQMKSLKQVNVSVDAEKTKIRIKEDFSCASKDVKNKIAGLTGQAKNSIYRVYNTGTVGARLVLAMSQILDVTPFYYTGEQDDKEPFQETLALLFLQQRGYKKLLNELGVKNGKKIRKPRGSKKSDDTPTSPANDTDIKDEPAVSVNEESAKTVNIQMALSDSDEMNKTMEDLTEDNAVLLLKSLFYRSKAGGQAKELANLVKRCLLT